MNILWGWLAIAQAEEIEIKVWHAYRDAEREAFELLEEYDAQNPQVKINTLAVALHSMCQNLKPQYHEEWTRSVCMQYEKRSWAQSGLITPIDVMQTALQDLHPTTINALQFEDQLYGLPLAFKCLAMFRNTDLLPTAPENSKQLFQAAAQFQGTDVIPLAYQATEAYFHAPWMHGFGGGFFDKEGIQSINSQAIIDSLQFLIELDEKGLIPKEPTSSLVTQLFNQNQAALVINGPWFLSSIADEINYEIHPLPIISKTGKPAAPFITVEGLLVSAFSTHQEDHKIISF